MEVCRGCEKSFEENSLIKTDLFGGDAIVLYFDACSLEGVRDGFGDKDLECVCEEKISL